MIAAALLLTLGAAPSASADKAAAEPRFAPAQIAALDMLRSLRDPQAPPPAELGEQIGALGGTNGALLIDVLVTRVVPAPSETAQDQALSIYQEEAVLVALGELPARVVLACVEARLGEEPGLGELRAAVQALGALGEAEFLDRLFELAIGPDPHADQILDASLKAPLEQALAQLLARDARAIEELTESPLGAARAVHAARACGLSRNPHTVALLTQLLDSHDELTMLIATQVPLVAPSPIGEHNEALAVRLRRLVKSKDPTLAQAAIGGLVALHDYSSTEVLIALLESDEEVLRQRAHAGLRELTGLGLPADRNRWQLWLEEELRWFADHERPTLRELRSGDLATVSRALQRLSQRRLFRDRLAVAVLGLLEERNPVLRRLACETLDRLDEPLAIERLTEALDDRDATVADAARDALRNLTGKEPVRVAERQTR